MKTHAFLGLAAVLMLLPLSGIPAQDIAVEQDAGIDETAITLQEAPLDPIIDSSPSIFPYVLRMILVLALVLGLIYGLYWLLKKAGRPRIVADSHLKILASTSLSTGKSLHIVSLGDRAWLLGASDSSISMIAEIDDKEIIDTLELDARNQTGGDRLGFTAIMAKMLKQKSFAQKKPDGTDDFLSRQRNRFKDSDFL